jgi:cytochrome c553
MKKPVALAALLFAIPFAHAAPNLEAGKAKVAAVCAACHGATGVSVSETIPNLAAQRAPYIENQPKAFKDGARRGGPTSPAATMTAIATQLSAEDIANVAAYFASLPGPASGMKSDFLPAVAKTNVAFPEGYSASFKKYHTINFPATKQVRYYFANPAAISAAKAGKDLPNGSVLFAEVHSAQLDAGGKPVMGPDGFFVPDKLLFYTAMQRDAGWGKDIPDLLRNEDWHYAIFTTDKKLRPGQNHAECLGCHKPLDKVSYTFTLKELAGVK